MDQQVQYSLAQQIPRMQGLQSRALYSIVFLVTFLPLFTKASQPIVIQSEAAPIYIGPQVQFLSDPGFTLDLDAIQSPEFSVQFQDCADEYLHFGMDAKAVWVRFQVEGNFGPETSCYLNLGSPRLDTVTFFHPNEKGGYDRFWGGITIPYKDRIIQRREPVFKITPKLGGSEWYYLRIASPLEQNFLPSLQTPKELQIVENRFLVELAIGVALLFIAMVVGLLQYFMQRNKLSLYFAWMILVSTGTLLFFYGFVQQFFLTETGYSIALMLSIMFPVLKTPIEKNITRNTVAGSG